MYEYFKWAFDIVRKADKKCMVYGNWVNDPMPLDPARSNIENRIYIDELIHLFSNNKDIFKKDVSDTNMFAINWLNKLKDRIGTIKQDNNELENLFLQMKFLVLIMVN